MKIWHLAPGAQGYLEITQHLETNGAQFRTGIHTLPLRLRCWSTPACQLRRFPSQYGYAARRAGERTPTGTMSLRAVQLQR